VVSEGPPNYLNAYRLLGEIYEQQRDFPAAAKVYRDASKIRQLSTEIRSQLEAKSRAMRSSP
jgi:hypothetical protein